jgi:hypothetical protein
MIVLNTSISEMPYLSEGEGRVLKFLERYIESWWKHDGSLYRIKLGTRTQRNIPEQESVPIPNLTHRMKVHSVWWATARASRVLPVPGGPYRSTPSYLNCDSSVQNIRTHVVKPPLFLHMGSNH